MFRVSSTPSAKKLIGSIRRELKTTLNQVGAILLDEARKATPVAKGRARRGWTKRSMNNEVRIANRVPYIERLENNYSKQTKGRGVMTPAIRNTNKRRVR